MTGQIIRMGVTLREPYLPFIARRAHDRERRELQAQEHCSNVHLYKHIHAMLENTAMNFNCIWLCLQLEFKSIRNVTMIEMLRILKESPRELEHENQPRANIIFWACGWISGSQMVARD